MYENHNVGSKAYVTQYQCKWGVYIIDHVPMGIS
jgi:hypothetical protein